MVTFPNAKINIGLSITRRREDGYHDLETLFYPIDLCDVLEIVPTKNNETTLTITGIAVDGDIEKNLVMRAYRLLQSQYNLPAVDINLHKVIPFGAGLGGGSADAAFTLKMLRDMFALPLNDEQLAGMASNLGADCPFFIYNRPLIATGIGDCFASTEFSLKGKFIILVKPSIAVSTAEAYAGVTPQVPQKSLNEKLSSAIDTWRNEVVNDFERASSRHILALLLSSNDYTIWGLYMLRCRARDHRYSAFSISPITLQAVSPTVLYGRANATYRLTL